MGNWRTVRIEGTCNPADIPALNALLCHDYMDPNATNQFSCLGWAPQASLCGLNEWVAPTIDVVGNLQERDYDVEDVADALRKCVDVAPSLRVFIDCGGDYEDRGCVATVVVGEDRTVATLSPRVEQLPEIEESQIMGNFLKALGG